MTKSRAEQETVIRRAADEQEWDVWTEDPRVIRKLSAVIGPGTPHGAAWRWRVPPNVIQFRRPARVDAAAKEKARAQFAANLARARERQGDGQDGEQQQAEA